MRFAEGRKIGIIESELSSGAYIGKLKNGARVIVNVLSTDTLFFENQEELQLHLKAEKEKRAKREELQKKLMEASGGSAYPMGFSDQITKDEEGED